MTNKQFQKLLKRYPNDLPVKLMVGDSARTVVQFDGDRIIESSETAYINKEAPEDQWDTEDGKIELGDGQRYLLINPIIV